MSLYAPDESVDIEDRLYQVVRRHGAHLSPREPDQHHEDGGEFEDRHDATDRIPEHQRLCALGRNWAGIEAKEGR